MYIPQSFRSMSRNSLKLAGRFLHGSRKFWEHSHSILHVSSIGYKKDWRAYLHNHHMGHTYHLQVNSLLGTLHKLQRILWTICYIFYLFCRKIHTLHSGLLAFMVFMVLLVFMVQLICIFRIRPFHWLRIYRHNWCIFQRRQLMCSILVKSRKNGSYQDRNLICTWCIFSYIQEQTWDRIYLSHQRIRIQHNCQLVVELQFFRIGLLN